MNIQPTSTVGTPHALSKVDEENFYFKIHGSITAIESAIFFTKDYHKAYNDERFNSLLKEIVKNNTCIFLGFSFTDLYVKEIFKAIDELLKKYNKQHYLFSTDILELPSYISQVKIDNYSELDTIIKKLKKQDEASSHISDTTAHESILHPASDKRDVQTYYGINPLLELEYVYDNTNEFKFLEEDRKIIAITGEEGQGKSILAHAFFAYVQESSKNYSYLAFIDFTHENIDFRLKLIGFFQSIKIFDKDILFRMPLSVIIQQAIIAIITAYTYECTLLYFRFGCQEENKVYWIK